MHRSFATSFATIVLGLALSGCDGPGSALPAQPMQPPTNATTTVGGATLQASTLDIADLNDTVAERYHIDGGQPGALLLVTVRDAQGNGIEPGDLILQATAKALTDPPKPLVLHAITTDGMTDYIGVFNVAPPATLQFNINAIRNGASAEITTNAELYPR